MNQQNQIEFHHLPSEILIRIYHLLNFRQRVRLERVCRIWRQAVLSFGWFEVRTLKVTDRVKNRHCSRPSRSLAKLSAILRRCGPHLEELYLGPGIGVHTRFGRYFRHLAVHQKLIHLRIDDSLDIWHLQQIAQYLAPQLISLSLNLCPISRKNRQNTKQKAKKQAWINLLANCQKLECLRINGLDDLFTEDEEGQLIVLLPKSVKYLQIWYEEQWNWEGVMESNKVKFQMLLNDELFAKLRFFLNNSYFELDEMLSNNAKLYYRFYSLQWPMLYAQNHSFLQLNLPNFRHLQALHLNCNIENFGLIQLAEFCPQLEHLDFKAHYAAGWGFDAPLRELEGLYAFHRLSSLAISIELRHFENFDELKCTTGEFADHVLMEIITKLNEINPLRSLDFKAAYPHFRYYPNFHEEFILELLENLKNLETFSCAIEPHECYFCLHNHYPHNPFHPAGTCWRNGYQINPDEFFLKLQTILDEQMEGGIKQSKTFKFTLLKHYGRGEPHSRITAKWNPNTREITWKNISLIQNFDYQIYPAYSIVLDELLDKVIDKRTRRFFFELIQ